MNLKVGKWIKWKKDLIQIVDKNSQFYLCHPMGEFFYSSNKDSTGIIYIDKDLIEEYPDDLEDPTISEVYTRIENIWIIYK